MKNEEYIKPEIKDKPKPKLKDSGFVKWLEDHLGFRPFGVEW